MLKPTTPEAHGRICPACGVAFQLADRRKRVQCPHCLEIVELGAERSSGRATQNGSAQNGVAKDNAEVTKLRARVQALEARTAELEARLAGMLDAPPPATPPRVFKPAPEPESEPMRVLIQAAQTFPSPTTPAEEIPSEREATLVSRLRAFGPRRIAIETAPGNTAAAARGAQLRQLFAEAGWTGSADSPTPRRWCDHPLALIAPADARPREIAELFSSLVAAGLTPVSQIDPTLHGCDPILSLGPHS